MREAADIELPTQQEKDLRKAIRLAWITIGYLCVDAVIVYSVMGASQAMMATLIEDLLNLAPPISFLIADRIRRWEPSERFPYGLHGAMSIAFLSGSLALIAMGGYLLYDSIMELVNMHHPTIGTMDMFGLFGEPIWQGWVMLPVIVYSIPIAYILGRWKMPLSRSLHDKALHAGAKMNKADWMTGAAALVGVGGIAFGIWWTDAVAASFIAIDILRDGYRNTTSAVADLVDRVPETVDESHLDPLPSRLAEALKGLDWVVDAQVRMREEGHVFFGEAFIVPTEENGITDRIQDALKMAYDLDWRLQDLTIQPVAELRAEGDIDTEHGQDRGER